MISYSLKNKAQINKKYNKSGSSKLLLDNMYSADAFNIRVLVAQSNEMLS